MELALHFDLRAPEIGPSVDELYRTAIEQCAWAEKRGFDLAILSCHHGCDDDYGSSQIVTAAGIASRTSTMRLQPIVSLPLYHPLHVAEDLLMLDTLFGGIPIDIAWDSLELFVDKVLPAIKPAAVPPPVSEGAV